MKLTMARDGDESAGYVLVVGPDRVDLRLPATDDRNAGPVYGVMTMRPATAHRLAQILMAAVETTQRGVD